MAPEAKIPQEGTRQTSTGNSKMNSRASISEELDAQSATGLMPAAYAGLEVAQNRHGGGADHFTPYRDVASSKPVYNHQHQQQQQQYQQYQHQQIHPDSQGTVAIAYYGGGHVKVPPTEGGHEEQQKRIWGLRAATFWVGVVALVFFLGTISAGAAAGSIAQSCAAKLDAAPAALASPTSIAATAESTPGSASESTSTSSAMSTAAAAATAAATTANSFTAIPVPQQASSIHGDATTNCPQLPSENRTYSIPGTSMRFTRECGNNYPFNDLGNVPMTRMEDCMNLCAALSISTQSVSGPCVGVAWVTAGKQGTDQNYCWLKSAKGKPDPKANVEVAWLTLS